MDGEQAFGLDLVEARGRGDLPSGLVHVRLRLQQSDLGPVDPKVRHLARELRSPRTAVPHGQLVRDHETHVVPGRRVLAPGITEPDHEKVERRGSIAPTKQAHDYPSTFCSSPAASASGSAGASAAPPGCSSGASPSMPSSPSSPSTASGSGSSIFVGGLTVASTVSGSSRNWTPSCTLRSERRRLSPIIIRETSSSRWSGTSIGNASTRTSRLIWLRTPPSF